MPIRILIVDDEEDLLDLLREEFERSGCDVATSRSGHAALQLLEREEPSAFHAVISDIRMPDGDGIFLLDAIRKRDSAIPAVFLMTGYSDLDRCEILAKGALDLIEKPFQIPSLVSEILSRIGG